MPYLLGKSHTWWCGAGLFCFRPLSPYTHIHAEIQQTDSDIWFGSHFRGRGWGWGTDSWLIVAQIRYCRDLIRVLTKILIRAHKMLWQKPILSPKFQFNGAPSTTLFAYRSRQQYCTKKNVDQQLKTSLSSFLFKVSHWLCEVCLMIMSGPLIRANINFSQ